MLIPLFLLNYSLSKHICVACFSLTEISFYILYLFTRCPPYWLIQKSEFWGVAKMKNKMKQLLLCQYNL